MKDMRVSIVIPVYNNEELLRENLPHVAAALQFYGAKNSEIVASNDNSLDNSLAVLNEFKKKTSVPMIILDHKTNERGFSVNVNRGVRKATGDIVILLGTDVKPTKDFVTPLIAHFADEKIFAVGCVNKSDEDVGKEVLRGRGIGRWEKGFLFHSHGDLIDDTTLWVDCGSGAFRRSIWWKIGGLQELYKPFYWEDVDISYRAQKMGYTVKIEKKSLVIHEHKKGVIKKEKSKDVGVTASRNQFYFVWLNITDARLVISHLLWLPYHLVTAIKGSNSALLKGFAQALLHLPQVMAERAKIISHFTVRDEQILQLFKKEL